MGELLLDDLSRQLLHAFLDQPKHALIISGDSGSGTLTTAMWMARELTKRTESIQTIAPEKGTISIEQVRNLYSMTRSVRTDAFVVVIDDANTMGVDAQNTLLKLLEEPPTNVFFILTTHITQGILDTIQSRCEHITLRPISRKDSERYVISLGVHEAAEQSKLLFLAAGKPAELHRLINDDQYYRSTAERMGDARRFLEAKAYERLIIIKNYMTSRADAEAFLLMIGRLLTHMTFRNLSSDTAHAIEVVNTALEALAANGNVRAQLLRFSNQLR